MINSAQSANTANSFIESLDAKRNATKNQVAETQDRFLKLLVTQMKNQDPLNPMDNAQVTSQMAQLSTVSGIDKLNATLQALSNSMAVAQSVSATNMIGHGVLVPGTDMRLVNGQALGGVELTQPADSVSVTIQGANGNVVRTLQLGAHEAGVLPFAWDGKNDAGSLAADGAYKISVTAMLSGEKLDPVTLAFDIVNSVTPGVNGAVLDVGQLGSFELSDIKQIM